MSAENLSAQEAFERFEGMLRDWLRDSGGTRIDIDYHAIHRTGFITNWLTIDGQRKGILLPFVRLRWILIGVRGRTRTCGWRPRTVCCIRSRTGCVSQSLTAISCRSRTRRWS